MITFIAAAHAGTWTKPEPYLAPSLNLSLVWVDGDTSARAAVGALGGARVRTTGRAHWLSDTRASALGQYGLDTGSLGADLRLGSFVGPETRALRWQVGPELWANGYGDADAEDGYLPWSPGLAVRNALTVEAGDFVAFLVEASPGWAFTAARRTGGVGPFDELDLSAAIDLHTRYVALRVGYTRAWRSFGTQDAIVLYGSL